MAYASSNPVIRQDAGGRKPTQICYDNLQAYARNRLDAAAAYPKDRLLRRDFRLVKLDMTIWFSSEALANLCDRTLVRHEHDDPSAPRVEVCAIDAERDGWEAPALWREDAGFASRDFDRILSARNLRGFYHHDAPSWQFYDRAISAGVLTLPGPMGIPPWESGSPFRLFLHWAYAAANMRLTHAATLGLGGYGALIAGASGSGKSSTALAGLMNGLDSAGDDYVLVEQGSRVMAHSVFTVFKQDREGLRRAGVAQSEIDAAELNWHGKVEFEAAKLSPKGLADQMEIGALLIPEVAKLRRTVIQTATAREAALSLAPSGVFQLPGDTTEGFGFLAGLVRRLPAFRVRLSEDPAEIADAIGAFLTTEQRNAG
jgi:hypothetical protein